MTNHHNEPKLRFDAIEMILKHTNEWYVLVDDKSHIIGMSEAYKNFVGIEDPQGRHVTEVIENTRMHLVVKTGIPERNMVQLIRGNKMIASRIPIIEEGVVIGAIGKATFKDIDDLFVLYNQVKKNHKKISVYVELGNSPQNAKFTFDDISGTSKATLALKSLARKSAKSDSNVLIVGPSGTGKELYAHAIHHASHRSSGPMIMVNCAAIPSELLESELFGYAKGAFTGANKGGKKGRFELADNGTLFLDEIGDMPLAMQAKLLRVLQSKEVDPVGGDCPIPINVRIIAATNQPIETLVEEGRFRSDLYYRLNVMRLDLLPLKDRSDEIMTIAEELLHLLSKRMGLEVKGFEPSAARALCLYPWPGNIRELENVLERALNLLEEGLWVTLESLPKHIRDMAGKHLDPEAFNLNQKEEDLEKDFIQKALQETYGNKKRAAELLGISRASFYHKLKKYQL